jgi:V/A-type H+-transporting ATPase subunit D
VPTLRQLPPGRAGVLWLRHRLAVAQRGADLLQQKLAILTIEAQRLELLLQRTERDWRERARAAEEWLVRAALSGGQRAIRLASPAPSATAEPAWTTVMGVRYPAEPSCHLPEESPDAAGPGPSALTEAQHAYREAVPAAVRHAAAAAAGRRVAAEIATTRQRVRALERHWIPRLQAALAAAELQMEELEHADAVRRHWAAGTAPTNAPERPL